MTPVGHGWSQISAPAGFGGLRIPASGRSSEVRRCFERAELGGFVSPRPAGFEVLVGFGDRACSAVNPAVLRWCVLHASDSFAAGDGCGREITVAIRNLRFLIGVKAEHADRNSGGCKNGEDGKSFDRHRWEVFAMSQASFQQGCVPLIDVMGWCDPPHSACASLRCKPHKAPAAGFCCSTQVWLRR